MAKVVKVSLPIDKPKDTMELCVKAIEKHTELGAASPLTGFVDMAAFSSKTTDVINKRKAADKHIADRQAKYQNAKQLCGLEAGQTKDTPETIYWHVQKTRNTLLVKYKGIEETLSQFGFDVVITQTGARKNVRVELPIDSTEDMTELAEDILEKHTELGASSPLTDAVDIADMTDKTTDCRTLLNERITHFADSQTLNNEAIVIIGYGVGQTSHTDGTLYFDICKMRDRLLDYYQGREESLTQFGFDVVISKKRNPKTKPGETEIVTLEGNLDPSFITQLNLTDINADDIDTFTFRAMGSAMRYYASATINTPPGPGQPFYEVLPGNNLVKTPEQVENELNFNEINNQMHVMNSGMAAGQYVVNIKMK
jgi:hypothetical protein